MEKKNEIKCGSDTMKNGKCTVCGAEPRVDPRTYSKKEWEKVKHKYNLLTTTDER